MAIFRFTLVQDGTSETRVVDIEADSILLANSLVCVQNKGWTPKPHNGLPALPAAAVPLAVPARQPGDPGKPATPVDELGPSAVPEPVPVKLPPQTIAVLDPAEPVEA